LSARARGSRTDTPVTDCYRDRASVWVESPEAAAARYPPLPLEVAGRVLSTASTAAEIARVVFGEGLAAFDADAGALALTSGRLSVTVRNRCSLALSSSVRASTPLPRSCGGTGKNAGAAEQTTAPPRRFAAENMLTAPIYKPPYDRPPAGDVVAAEEDGGVRDGRRPCRRRAWRRRTPFATGAAVSACDPRRRRRRERGGGDERGGA
jgi:hypothetical protein